MCLDDQVARSHQLDWLRWFGIFLSSTAAVVCGCLPCKGTNWACFARRTSSPMRRWPLPFWANKVIMFRCPRVASRGTRDRETKVVCQHRTRPFDSFLHPSIHPSYSLSLFIIAEQTRSEAESKAKVRPCKETIGRHSNHHFCLENISTILSTSIIVHIRGKINAKFSFVFQGKEKPEELWLENLMLFPCYFFKHWTRNKSQLFVCWEEKMCLSLFVIWNSNHSAAYFKRTKFNPEIDSFQRGLCWGKMGHSPVTSPVPKT